MEKTFEINRVYRLEDFKPEWLPILGSRYSRYSTIWLPTEMVVKEPKLVVPQEGRIFETRFYRYPMEKFGSKTPRYECPIVDYDGLMAMYKANGQEFHGTGMGPEQVLLVEVYWDFGYDGHTDCQHVGYRFVLANTFHAHEKNRLYGSHEIPTCMTEGEPDPRWWAEPKEESPYDPSKGLK